MGSDKVFDVLSEVLYNINLSQLLMEAAANARSMDEILREIDIKVDKDYIDKVKENLGESLATRYIDYTRIKEMQQQALEYRLIPEYTEAFFKKALIKAGGKFKERKDGFLAIDSIPFEIRRVAEQDTLKRCFGECLKKYPKVTFDKEIAFKNSDAEFISFGHPLFEAIMVWIENNLSGSLRSGATFTDPDGNLDGYILFYEGEIKDCTNSVAGKRLFGFYTDENQIKPVSSSIIWDLAEADNIESDAVDVEVIKKRVSTTVIPKLEEYKRELFQERIRQAGIKEKYGISSLEYLIIKLDGDLITLYDRKEKNENVDLAIRNKEERKEGYEKALTELKKQIQNEKRLTMSTPRFVGVMNLTPCGRTL